MSIMLRLTLASGIFMALMAVLDGDKFMLPHSLEWPMLIPADAGLALQAKRLRTASQA